MTKQTFAILDNIVEALWECLAQLEQHGGFNEEHVKNMRTKLEAAHMLLENERWFIQYQQPINPKQ